MIHCDGPECPKETKDTDWRSRLTWGKVRIEVFRSGQPAGDEKSTANATRTTVELNFCSDECWQNWRRNGAPVDWPKWEEYLEASGSQLLKSQRQLALSAGEIPKGKIVNPEAE